MTDLEQAEGIVAKRVAELDERFCGHDGFPSYGVFLVRWGIAPYRSYTANGIKEQGRSYGPLAPTAIDAAKGWVSVTHRHLDSLTGTLFWRKRPKLEFQPAVSFEEAYDDEWSSGMSAAGWRIMSRLVVIPEAEPATGEQAVADIPPTWEDKIASKQEIDEARERYLVATAKRREAAHG